MKHLSLLALVALSLSSCAYTGDPNQGGLFGWSQPMADQRIADRERRLSQLENDNAYQAGRSHELERQAYKKKASVNQY